MVGWKEWRKARLEAVSHSYHVYQCSNGFSVPGNVHAARWLRWYSLNLLSFTNNMKKQIFKDLFRLRRLIVLQIRLENDGLTTCHVYELNLSGEKLQVTDRKSGFKNIAHFSRLFRPGPLMLCLSGRGVLSKQIDRQRLTDEQVFAHTLPNARPDDFYMQWVAREDLTAVSVVRKEVADPYIEELTRGGFEILALNLGPETAEQQENAIKLLLGAETVKAGYPGLQENYDQVVAKARFQGMLMLSGLVLLLVLLINFFFFSVYSDKTEQLMRQNNITGAQVKKYQEMEETLQQKAVLIKHAGWTGGYPCAWLTDRLMASKPFDIGISGFTINPLRLSQPSTTVPDEVYETGKIRINGNSGDASTLNNWLHKIRAMNWVKTCDIASYGLNRDISRGEFVIEISISDYEGRNADEG